MASAARTTREIIIDLIMSRLPIVVDGGESAETAGKEDTEALHKYPSLRANVCVELFAFCRSY